MFTRALAAVAAGGLCAGLAAAVPSLVAPATASTQQARVLRTGHITWKACSDSYMKSAGLKCAKLRVPLDYRHPRGRKITLALSIRPHKASAGKYLGAILTNPGGPGGSGTTLPPFMQDNVPNGVGYRFDWIGFDPRGVGASRPVLHCNKKYVGTDRPSYIPTSKHLMKYWRKKARNYARSCGSSSARRLLPFMTTADNARDMDSIRKALGLRKISYYGFSWGSYLGQDYMTLFPHHVKRVVLDGVVDPRRVWYGANLDQDRVFDKNMDVFWKWVAANDSTFHLGTSGAAVKAKYYAELAKLKAHPAAGGKLGPDELSDAMLDAGYYVYGWQDDAQMFADLVNKGAGGAMLAAFRATNSGAANENGYAVYNAVQCTDNPWPGWAKTRKDSWRIYKKAPFETWGNTWYNAPCLNWPAKAKHRLHIHQKAGVPNFLLINETSDAATPYSGALEVRKRFHKARLIAGVGGTTHAGSLSGVSCTDNRIAHYLATGKVPKRVKGKHADVKCPPVPVAPIVTTGRVEVPQSLAIARQPLIAAQR
jgi:pimeloyl-ACP methyl ester carboxylesterase